MSQKGLAPILIVLLMALVVGGYLVYSNYSNNRTKPSFTERILTYEEVEGFVANCQVYSIGKSHKDIERGYLSINLRNVESRDNWFKVDKNYDSQIREKVEEVTSSGKCPKVIYWME